jgi:iron(III) transport system substrate-binding protein
MEPFMRRLIAASLVLVALAAPALAADETLVLYTSQPNTDAQATADAFMAANPGVKVDWVRDGTPKIIAKLRAEIEAGSPQPDVLLISDVVTMESLKQDNLLAAYPTAPVGGYDPAIMDKDFTYFSTKLITTGIVYNTKATMRPESWFDLTTPAAKDQVTMPSPLSSGAAMIHTVTLAGNLTGGWDFYTALAKNGAVAAGANGDVETAVAGGDKLYGMIVDYLPIREAAKGAPVAFVFPKEGVSAVTEPVAILKSARHPELARKFVDFVLSEAGQKLWSKLGYIPADPKVALPPGYPDRAAIKVLPYDAAAAVANDAENKQKFSDIFAQ